MATFRVPRPDVYPERTVGKLFGQFDGQLAVASASVVNRNGILTAAHCLYNPGSHSWGERLAFYPAYANGPSNYGGWAVSQSFLMQQWMDGDGWAWDYGFSQLSTGGNQNRPVGDVVGKLGVIVDRALGGAWVTEGYPGVPIPNYPFDGQHMWACVGNYTGTVDHLIGKEDNLTPGSSGGPWQPTADRHYANGVQSHKRDDAPGQCLSPYFDRNVITLYQTAFGRVSAQTA